MWEKKIWLGSFTLDGADYCWHSSFSLHFTRAEYIKAKIGRSEEGNVEDVKIGSDERLKTYLKLALSYLSLSPAHHLLLYKPVQLFENRGACR